MCGGRMSLLLIAVTLSLFPSVVVSFNATCTGPKTPGELRQHLWAGENSKYEKLTRPGFAKWISTSTSETSEVDDLPPPDIVQVQLHVISVKSLDQKRGEFQLIAWLRQRWTDPRLAYFTRHDGEYGCFPDKVRQGFPSKYLSEIWTPDIVIENEVSSGEMAESFWVYPTGQIVVAKFMKATLSCDMDLSDFPQDTQKCFIRVGTWMEDAGDVQLDYYNDIPPITQIDKDEGSASEFIMEIDGDGVTVFLDQEKSTQKESTLQFNLKFIRNRDHYEDFVILPAVFFVTIGWASFFIARGAAPARVTMSMICFLTNVNFLSNQLRTLPQQGNSIYLLQFLTVSTIFCFYAVLEYVICNVLMRIEKRVEAAHVKAAEMKAKKLDMEEEDEEEPEQPSTGAGEYKKKKKKNSMAKPRFETNYQDLKAIGFDYKLDRFLLSHKGHLVFRDQHLDILSRYLYPIAYIACVYGLKYD